MAALLSIVAEETPAIEGGFAEDFADSSVGLVSLRRSAMVVAHSLTSMSRLCERNDARHPVALARNRCRPFYAQHADF